MPAYNLHVNMHFTFTSLLITIFCCYTVYSVYSIYSLFSPSECASKDDQYCLNPAFKANDQFQLFLCTSTQTHPLAEKLDCFYHNDSWTLGQPRDLNFNITLPTRTVNNGTLILTAVLTKLMSTRHPNEAMLTSRHTITTQAYLTRYQFKKEKSYNLLKNQQSSESSVRSQRPETHWKSSLVLNSLYQPFSMSKDALPREISHLIQLDGKKHYLPIIYISDVRQKTSDILELPKKKQATKDLQMPLRIVYEPITIGRLRFTLVVENSLRTIKRMGFSDKEIEDVKSIFFDTNHWMLLTTIVIVMLHTLFDFLAFKNDIQFWRRRETLVGISVNTIIYRFISSLIITLYLIDKNSSMLVTLPLAIGTIIELWKLNKVSSIRWVGWFRLERIPIQRTPLEEQTKQYDDQIIRFLSLWIMPPLLIGGAIYSVSYVEHRSWYSWAIESLANGVYGFGFIAMLPQLFINYRLKSVAHLPWRAFMYKSFNTFIDDFFAFLIVSLPTTHRLATFRDDIVFIVYLYQRWLYGIDPARSELGVAASPIAASSSSQTEQDERSKKDD